MASKFVMPQTVIDLGRVSFVGDATLTYDHAFTDEQGNPKITLSIHGGKFVLEGITADNPAVGKATIHKVLVEKISLTGRPVPQFADDHFELYKFEQPADTPVVKEEKNGQ